MEVLDRVYDTFCRLERDYKRSKKTRTEFITDKFGGDIAVGSMIILDAVSSSTGEETPKDIRKLTFVKHVIDSVKANADSLDTLPDFSFSGNDLYTRLLSVLDSSLSDGTGIRTVSQADLHKKRRGAVHIIATPKETLFTPFERCTVLHAYNDAMCGVLSQMRGGESLRRGTYHSIRGTINPEEMTLGEVSKAIQRAK